MTLEEKGIPQLHGPPTYRTKAPGASGESGSGGVFAFDLLSIGGKDMLPLLERKAALQRLLDDSHRIRYLQHVAEHGEALYQYFQQMGFEGVVAKQVNGPYKVGRFRPGRR